MSIKRMKSSMKKAASLLICVSMILSSVQVFAAGNDYSNHWAEKAISGLMEDGILSGYEDNSFRPENKITKAELIVIINKLMGYTEKAEQQFDDVAENAWYADQLLIARKAGYFSGVGNNMAKADDYITRQDAFTLIARCLNLSSTENINFSDKSNISDYALNSISALVQKGFVNGYEDGTIQPKNNMTRSEIAWLVYSIKDSNSTNTETKPEDEPVDEPDKPAEGNNSNSSSGGGGGSGSSSSDNEEDDDVVYAALTSLSVSDITFKSIFNENTFSKSKTNYSVNVQSDIYGVLVKAKAPSFSTITVTASTDTYTYTNAPQYVAGTEIAYNEQYGGYIIPLDQTYGSYDSEFVQTASIRVTSTGKTARTYKITIIRECDKEIFKAFSQDTFIYDDGSEEYEIDYNIYFPKDFETSDKEYPVVLALHGSGQRYNESSEQQVTDMILKRYQLATIWAKDSVADPNKECIVIAPQINMTNSASWVESGVVGVDEFDMSILDISGKAAYALLESIMDTHSAKIDANRVYVTGASMGGRGALAMINEHPETFAALLSICGETNVDTFDWDQLKENFDGKLYFVHSEDDSSSIGGINYSSFEAIEEKLEEHGINYYSTIYDENTIFWPSAHFSWVPGCADERIREWLFTQEKDLF